MDKITLEFIQQHINDDILKLSLQSRKYPDIDFPLAIRQIAGKQKFRKKVPLFFLHPEILFPVQLSVEQASSEDTAKYKSDLVSGNAFADLTGGFGVDFYFISQKFAHGIYVERDIQLCELANSNFKTLGINSFKILNQKAEDFIKEMPEVDFIYLDPHRRSESGKKTIRISDCEPDVSVLIEKMLERSRKVMIKLSPMLDIRQAIADVPQTTEIHIIAVENECKEVLLIINRDTQHDDKSVHLFTTNILKNGKSQQFDFHLDDEANSEAVFTNSPLQYLYEPNAAIMKSGAFKTIGSRFGLNKFHPNTHIYTDNTLKTDFPGRIFSIQEVTGNSKDDFKLLKQKYPKANIILRNYPLSVDEYKKKSRIKDGGDYYIHALKANDNNLLNIISRRIPNSQSN